MGSQVYGFALFDPDTKREDLRVHDVNEKISIKTLELTERVYYHLAKEFLAKPNP